MRKALALALVAAVALVAPAAAANVEIGGYIDVGWYDLEGGGTNAVGVGANPAQTAVGSTNGAQTNRGQQTSAVNEVNIDLTAELADNVTVFTSFDAVPTGGRADATNVGGQTPVPNGGAVTLDMAYVDFQNPGAMPINVRVGAIPSVIGIEQREAEANQKRTVSLSLLSPYTVGAIVGTGVYGSFDFVNYQVAWANTDPFGSAAIYANAGAAPNGGTISANLERIAPENNGITGADNDNNRTIQGRLGVTPLEGLEIGVSGTIGKYARPIGVAGRLGDQERRLVGFDVGYVWGPWSAKAEYVSIDEDNNFDAGAADNKVRSWYVEGAYEFGSIASMAKSGGLVVRYGNLTIDVDSDDVPATGNVAVEVADVDQLVIGGWLDLSNDVRMKLEYQINDEDSNAFYGQADSNNDVLAMSVIASF